MLEPANGALYRARARAHLALGLTDRAITDCDLALELQPRDLEARYLSAQAH